ncbi:hypothetical protein Tco_0623183 [Tanacetum coccineum]
MRAESLQISFKIIYSDLALLLLHQVAGNIFWGSLAYCDKKMDKMFLPMFDNTCLLDMINIVADHAVDILFYQNFQLIMSTVIRLCIPQRRSTRLTSPTPILTTDKADDLVLQDTLQVSLAEQKRRKELEATQNVEKVKEHLMAEEIEKLVEGIENVEENVVVRRRSAEDDYKLKRREKGKHVEEIRHTPSPTTIRSPRIQSTLVSSDTEKSPGMMENYP